MPCIQKFPIQPSPDGILRGKRITLAQQISGCEDASWPKKYIYICYDILNKIYLEYHSQLHYICTLKTICMKQKKKHTLLKGEGINQHTLYGEFKIDETETDFTDLVVTKESLLKHEQPTGAFSNEHQTLKIEKGEWSMGKQVEYNPFNQQITRVWD